MNTEYGTLTIRSEVAVPLQHDTQNFKYRRATLATYPAIPRNECSEIIDRFCEANNTPRANLFCEWKYVGYF